MNLGIQIAIALILDFLLGDPRWLPHPVQGIGRSIRFFEKRLRASPVPLRSAGIILVLLALSFSVGSGWLLLTAAAVIAPWAAALCGIILLYFCLAARGLAAHATRVRLALEADNIIAARQQLAMIVGRDTIDLDEEAVVRAAVESVAENIVDGITAPLFYGALFGPLAALAYKAINTLDSMVGYRDERYLELGWAAARLDDWANFIPARLTGLLLVVAARLLGEDWRGSRQILRRDRLAHASPNSGHSEAAMAGALGLQLGGVSSYFGQPVVKPSIGDAKRVATAHHIRRANRLLWVTTILGGLMAIGLHLVPSI